MSKLRLFNPNQFKSFPKIPPGTYPFIVTDWDFDPDKSVVTVTIETPSRNRELPIITELEMEEAIGKYIKADMTYSQGNEKIFANLEPESYQTDDGSAFKTNSSHCTWDWIADEY